MARNKIASSQQLLSIAIGVLLIASVLLPVAWIEKINPTTKITLLISKTKQHLGLLLHSSTPQNLLKIGVLNGFLPCGLVYSALGGAIATGNTTKGVFFYVVFWIRNNTTNVFSRSNG